MSTKSSVAPIIGIISVGIIALIAIITPAIFLLTRIPPDSTDGSVATTAGDSAATAKQKAYLKAHPIINELPIIYANYDEQYNYTEFRIDGGEFPECSTDFCLKITDTTGGNYAHARELIKNSGYNPDDYEIIYEYKPITPLE